MEKKEIVIIGGGFAGISLARQLSNEKGVQVTLVDKNNYNFFPPLLYQVATGFLEPSNISYPFRKMFHGVRNVRFRMGELQRIQPGDNRVVLSTGVLDYDYLVLATGTGSNYFGIENIRKHALPMKSIDDAIELRNTLLLKMEEATRASDQSDREKMARVVIAGGGPTGVEVAGMLAEMRMNILEKDYPELRDWEFKIYLADAAPVLLTPMDPKSQRYTYETLTKMGVEVKLDKQVKDYIDDTVIFADGETIPTRLMIWTAGVTSQVFEGLPEDSFGRGRRLVVDAFNRVQGTHNIFAIGDTCIQLTDPNFPNGHPQLAQPAIQQGRNLARNFKAMLKNRPLKPFSYRDRGSMAIIGRSKAVMETPRPKLRLVGWFAWVTWLFVHLFSLINHRNRITTMYNWTVAYFSKDQSLRMIIRPSRDSSKQSDSESSDIRKTE